MRRPTLEAIACFALLASACAGQASIPSPDPTSPSRGGQSVSFDTSDGVGLTALRWGRGRVGVVLAHMFPAEEGALSWGSTAARLADAGYLALALNFRGYADSDGDRRIDRLHLDVAAAHSYLLDEGAEQVAYVGASMGATACLVAAATQRPAAVVSVSAPAQFRGLDAEAIARELDVPVLLLASEGDAAASSLEVLAGLLPDAQAKLFGGDAHGTNLVADAPSSEDEILTFLESRAPPA